MLQIPLSLVITSENSTHVIPNSPVTAGGNGSDLNGFAIKVSKLNSAMTTELCLLNRAMLLSNCCMLFLICIFFPVTKRI